MTIMAQEKFTVNQVRAIEITCIDATPQFERTTFDTQFRQRRKLARLLRLSPAPRGGFAGLRIARRKIVRGPMAD